MKYKRGRRETLTYKGNWTEQEPIFEDQEDEYETVDPNNLPGLQSLPKDGDFIIGISNWKGNQFNI